MNPKNLKNYSPAQRTWWVIGIVMMSLSWLWCGKELRAWYLQSKEQKNRK